MAAAGWVRRPGGPRTVMFLVSVLVLLAAVVVGDVVDDSVGGGGEDRESSLETWADGGGHHHGEAEDLFNWDEEEDDEEDADIAMVVGSSSRETTATGRPPTGTHVVNVESFGAKGDGHADDTQAFLDAWDKACSLEDAVFLVPAGRRYRVGASRFMGPCKSNMMVQIQGTIVAPEEPSQWDPRSPRLWLLFGGLVGARIEGGGVIDGSGSKWWANSCKVKRSSACTKAAPTAVTLDSCRGVRVRRLRIQNAQQMHLAVTRSRDVRLAGLRVEAPADSPNTDGIHIAESARVALRSCRIGTGDDCVSISNASFGVRMRGIECGPGHGISIGSLGAGGSAAAVAGVVLDGARVRRAQNGVRIKTWQGGSGYVRDVRFQDVRVEDVDHPIVIDQFYCDARAPCANRTSAVRVSGVVFRRITGTSTRADAIRLACSDAAPCRGIVLQDIDLRRARTGAEVQAVCNCAEGVVQGGVRPAVDCLTRKTTEAIRHTEL